MDGLAICNHSKNSQVGEWYCEYKQHEYGNHGCGEVTV